MADLFVKEGDNFVPYTVKVVPESDLLAAKGGLESQISTLKAEVEDAKKSSDQHYQRALKGEADATALKTELEPLKVEAAKVTQLTTDLQAATTGRTEMETRLLGVRRLELVGKFKLPTEKAKELDNLSASQLDEVEKTLTTFGAVPAGDQPPTRRSFDTGVPGGPGGPEQPRGRDLIKEGLRSSS